MQHQLESNRLMITDAINLQLSDHHLIIHNNILFWNIMMKANSHIDSMQPTFITYNNAFSLVDGEKHYLHRLIKLLMQSLK